MTEELLLMTVFTSLLDRVRKATLRFKPGLPAKAIEETLERLMDRRTLSESTNQGRRDRARSGRRPPRFLQNAAGDRRQARCVRK